MRTRLSFLTITSLLLGLFSISPAANSLNTNLEIQAITDSNSGEVRLTFNSKIARASVRSYSITATPNTPNAASYSKTFTRKVSGYVLQRVTALTPGTDYKFRVSIRTTNNRVINSADFNFYTRSIKPTTPVITRAFETDSDEAVVYFDAPNNDGQTPVLYYTAVATPGGATGTTLQQGSGSITITGLTKSTTYTFTITAHNINGTSVESRPSQPVTTLANKIVRVVAASSSGGSTLAAPAFTLSSSSQSVTVNSAITTVTNNPTGGTIASYAISPAAPAGLTFSNSTGQLSGTPTSIQTATNYTITATNAAGSATATFTLTVTRLEAKLSLSRVSIGNTAGVAFTTQPQITIQDADNNTVTTSSATVTATISAGGALVGTKTAVASAGVATFTDLGIRGWENTTYTITYSVTGLTSATQSVTTSSAYAVGSTGPGGGVIFYRSASGWTCGPTLNERCYYLEVAPPALGLASSDSDTVNSVSRTWAQSSYQTTRVPDFGDTTTAQAIGHGYRNTLLIINQGNSDSATSAAALAQSFRGGGFSDWFLPSRAEGRALCDWHQPANCSGNGGVNQNQAAGATGFVQGPYWTSSEFSATVAYIRNNVLGGHQGGSTKSTSALVRPIRAF
jgi:hypothetical protein